MKKFPKTESFKTATWIRPNVDTDMIAPAPFLKGVSKKLGMHAFDRLRYQDEGVLGMDCSERPLKEDFFLNQKHYTGAQCLIAGENFGCGSSREHAPWALFDYGFRVIIASSFADIFYNNSFLNGLLLIKLPEEIVQNLAETCEGYVKGYDEAFHLKISLEKQTIEYAGKSILYTGGKPLSFDIDAEKKRNLLEGLDQVGLTLENHAEDIRAYENRMRNKTPWIGYPAA